MPLLTFESPAEGRHCLLTGKKPGLAPVQVQTEMRLHSDQLIGGLPLLVVFLLLVITDTIKFILVIILCLERFDF